MGKMYFSKNYAFSEIKEPYVELILSRILLWNYIGKITRLVIFKNLVKRAVFYTNAEAEGTSNLIFGKDFV